MNSKMHFFNLSPHQTVNSTLCIVLLVSWCIFMVVFYCTRSVNDFRRNYTVANASQEKSVSR